MNRKIISIFLIFCMLFTLLPAGVFATEETPTSGDCSRLDDGSVTWRYDSNTKTLTISGSGDMTSFEKASAVPWYGYMEEIETAVIEDGVTNVGARAFDLRQRYLRFRWVIRLRQLETMRLMSVQV